MIKVITYKGQTYLTVVLTPGKNNEPTNVPMLEQQTYRVQFITMLTILCIGAESIQPLLQSGFIV